MPAKTRNELKRYFVKNAIPRESDFADLIDTPLSQAEDGVFRLPNEPLSVVSAGGTQRKVLQLYGSYPSPNPDWSLSLSPKHPTAPTTMVNGLGVVDGAGNTRLLLDAAGNLTLAGGLAVNGGGSYGGAVTVNGALAVGGAASIGSQAAITNARLDVLGGAIAVAQARASLQRADASIHVVGTAGGFGRLTQMSTVGTSQAALNLVASSDGNGAQQWWSWGASADNKWRVRSGTDISGADGLTLDGNGNLRASGEVQTTSANAFRMVRGSYGAFWRNDGVATYLLLTNANDMYGDWNNFRPFYVDNATGAVTVTNVGVWGDLTMKDGAIAPTAGSSAANGIRFPTDPGGGGGDTAWLRYYARTGESCTLELGIDNDADDHIALMPGGGVAIGSASAIPNAKLDVLGGAIAVAQSRAALTRADAALHIVGAGGGFGRLTQMSMIGNLQPALNLIASSNGAGAAQWWSWGVSTDNKWRIHPGTDLGGSDGLTVDGNGSVGIGTVSPASRLEVLGTATLRSPDASFYGLQFARTDEQSRQHIWSFWHMNRDYRKNALELWEYKTDRNGIACGGDPADGAMCSPRLIVAEGGSVGIGKVPQTLLDVGGLVRADGGALLAGVAIGCDPPAVPGVGDVTFPYPYETVGTTDPRYNLRLYGSMGIFLSVGTDANAFVTIDSAGRMGTCGRSPDDVPAGWAGGLTTFDLVARGSITCNNTVYCHKTASPGQDVAEAFLSEAALAPGDVVCLAERQGYVEAACTPYDSRVAGIVSTEPGVALGIGLERDSRAFPIALGGRVPCKVVDEGGAIAVGDLLTTSSTPGHAMKAVRSGGEAPAGTVIGKAMERFDGQRGVILVFVFIR